MILQSQDTPTTVFVYIFYKIALTHIYVLKSIKDPLLFDRKFSDIVHTENAAFA